MLDLNNAFVIVNSDIYINSYFQLIALFRVQFRE